MVHNDMSVNDILNNLKNSEAIVDVELEINVQRKVINRILSEDVESSIATLDFTIVITIIYYNTIHL